MTSKLTVLALAICASIFTSCENEVDISSPGNLVPKTVDLDPSLPSITVNGTMLHAEAFGNPTDPILIFLHGGPGGDYRNGMNVQELADDGFYVVFYDQRGSGLSQRHPKSTYSIQLVLDDLSAVIAHYRSSDSQKVFLLGHSWGAMLAAAYINSDPERIDGAIFAEAGGFTKDLLDEYGAASRKLNLFAEGTNDVLYYDQFLTGKASDHEILDYKSALQSPYSYAPGNDEGIEGPSPFWRNGAVVLNAFIDISEKEGFDFTTNLDKYSTMTLFLYGENNRSYGLAFAEKEASFFPSSTIAQIDDTGHEMIYCQWKLVHPIVLSYLNSLK